MESQFEAAAAALTAHTRGAEVSNLWFSAERSDFVRFNRGRVRQAGTVSQIYARIHLIDGARHAEETVTLAGNRDDEARIARSLDDLRAVLEGAPEDPFLLYSTEVKSTRKVHRGALPEPERVVSSVGDAGEGVDLVGFYAAGPIYRGFASSLGQRNWHEVESFNLEWSLYHRADKAIKTSYAGFSWSDEELAQRVARSKSQLRALSREPRTIAPGRYRAWLTPAALSEITGMLSWGGFSGRARETRQSCLLRMQTGDARMHDAVTLTENLAEGIAPEFQGDGFVRPASVSLVTKGRLGDALVSPRTAKEFSIAHNGASSSEMPDALDMAAGDIPTDEGLARLGTGIYVGNLWYLNFSDRAACRVTGMTRFGTFWVENGEIVAPLSVMRFDDSVFRVLGERLEGLSAERDFLPNALTFRERAVDSARLPAALVSELTLTL